MPSCGSVLWLRAKGSRNSISRNTSQATPELIPPVYSLRSSSTIDTVLAPLNGHDRHGFFSTGHSGYTNYSTLEPQP